MAVDVEQLHQVLDLIRARAHRAVAGDGSPAPTAAELREDLELIAAAAVGALRPGRGRCGACGQVITAEPHPR